MDRFNKHDLVDILFSRERCPACIHTITGERLPYWDVKDWNTIVNIPGEDRIAARQNMEDDYQLSDYEELTLLRTGWLLFKEKDYYGGKFDEWDFEIRE
jgi:hypothetical protein